MKALAFVCGPVLGLGLAVAACGNDRRPAIDDADADARRDYPDLSAIYAGEHGLYRGCGPNGGVCHNGNEFPNLSSLGAITENIGSPCNLKRDVATELDDLCERTGDKVQFGAQKIEIAYLEPWPTDPDLAWRLVLRERPAQLMPQGEQMQVWRERPDGAGGTVEIAFVPLAAASIGYLADPDDATGRTILLGLPQDPAAKAVVEGFFHESGTQRPDRLHYGDPNRNGTFGTELGGALIAPGDPDRSYLLRRLVDPSKGPLMPRANCCSWTRTSLRALWCWVDGLAPDGSNALAPIDYDRCRPSPSIELLYPEPGPMCEAQGLCPVQAGGGAGQPTFPSIYNEVLTAKCAGGGCHDQGAAGGVDLRSEQAAYDTLAARVVPGDPDGSLLIRRLSPELCTGDCKTMPLSRPPLPAADLERIRAWISDGAARE